MNEEENFDCLRKLLALKKHEQPPPGYFNRLPGQIMARIQSEEAQPRWWERIASAFTLKPAFAYSLGLAFCVTLLGGIYYGASLQPEQTALPQMAVQPWKAPAAATLASQSTRAFQPSQRNDLASTNPVVPTQPRSLFDDIQVQVAPVSYPSGN